MKSIHFFRSRNLNLSGSGAIFKKRSPLLERGGIAKNR
ncbi:hypothetical protein LEP1GSC064_0177 [Leptospira kirschneri serovar Grippotyphosa str. Moskva]|nr:hypothetical protein LEP1GSC018_3085 [Leptospira kirschneri str. 2008720114]EKQ81922.1 hypothetical protein LEP1GSC064_0177 [Leptospira kirschneri serovar Grippotyphosa str. Moskva]EKR09757.1 hypothetical protein LEP1GSC122_3196 [Leptospira kirschneri serovar Valbuzzi str. 200702274]EMK16283.1 hypothetical protein LEP1GSC042_0995 [Leptospira kirschneri serovar Bim str. PUO 1247]EMN04373.1 hypothetical protein LEP1GSC046_3918 [Leptospira kirschneri serovar Bim str. 1051]EMN25558.1 hypothetic